MRLTGSNGLLLAGMLAATVSTARAAAPEPTGPPIVGRWEITVNSPEGPYPSWLEVTPSGHKTLVGSFVGQFGSARPVGQVFFRNDQVEWSLPVQWEADTGSISFAGRLENGKLSGRHTDARGRQMPWSAVRAPSLARRNPPVWGAPISLFNGRDLSGWHIRDRRKPNGWVVRNGVLRNDRPGNDLITTGKFTDFTLHIEFRYPKGSNSGVYLRGRYEAQIEDDYGMAPESHIIGGIYGFLKPRINAARKAGEWQSYDITLVGRTVTLALNGETVIDRQEIPGPTGGMLDNNEGQPGPLMIQGDHGQIEYRNIRLTPAR